MYKLVILLCVVMISNISSGQNTIELTHGNVKVKIDVNTGMVTGISKGKYHLIDQIIDLYEYETFDENIKASEKNDVAFKVSRKTDLNKWHCVFNNNKIPDLEIKKSYSFDSTGALLKDVRLTNKGKNGFFIKNFVKAVLNTEFSDSAFYFQPRKGSPNAIKLARDIKEPIQIGWDQAERMYVNIFAPKQKSGIVHHRHRVDGRVCIPKVGNNFAAICSWTREGWKFSTCVFYLEPGKSHSYQMRIEVNDGDLMNHYMRYVELPEVQQEMYSYDIPEWVSDLDATIFGPAYEPHLENHLPWFMSMANNLPEEWADFLKKEKLSVAVNIGRHFPPWGDIVSEGIYDGPYGFRQDSRPLNLDSYREKIDALREQNPYYRFGQYSLLWWIAKDSKTFQEHPDWLIYRKDGSPDFEDHAWQNNKARRDEYAASPSYHREVGVPGAIAEVAKSAGKMTKNFGYDFFYIDGSPSGISRLNWKTMNVTQPYKWLDLHKAIRQKIRQANKEAVIFMNADVWPVAEINFWEYYFWHRSDRDWRHIAVSLPIAKIREPKGGVVTPLRWNDRDSIQLLRGLVDLSDRQYVGYVLGFGLVPMFENFTVQMARQRLPIVRAAKELRGSRMVNANIEPAWWHHVNPINVEAYTLKKENFGLIPIMSRQSETKTEKFSFDINPFGLSSDYPLYAWVHDYHPPTGDPMESTEPYQRAFTIKTIKAVDNMSERATFAIHLPGTNEIEEVVFGKNRLSMVGTPPRVEPGRLQLLTVSNTPAWIYSINGVRLQTALPKQKGVKIDLLNYNSDYSEFSIHSENETIKIFIPLSFLDNDSQNILLNGDQIKPVLFNWDTEKGFLFNIPRGVYTIRLEH